MIPPVVLVLALASSALALPLTTQEQTSIGSEGLTQINTELPNPQFIEKTGAGQVPSTVGQQIQQVSPLKVENAPVNVDKPQAAYTETPVLLPIQPLSVLPVTQDNQVFRPVIVPAEAITAGRVIIAGLGSIQQRNFPDEIASVETQVPYQPVVQPGSYVPVQSQGYEPNQQPYYVQPVEKQTPTQQGFVQTSQGYVPVKVQSNQEQLIREQVPVNQVGQQNVENYKPVPAEQSAQIYSAQQVGSESAEKSGTYQGYTSTQTAQQTGEKQGFYPQGGSYSPVQTQGVETLTQVYSGKPITTENVEKQATQQLLGNSQTGEKQGEYQTNTYTPGRNQPVDQQVENVQQPFEKQEQYQQVYNQAQSVEQQAAQGLQQVQRVQPAEGVYQQQGNSPVAQVQPGQNYPAEQQVYNVKPVSVEHVGSQVSQQQVAQPQNAAYVPEQASKSTEGGQQEVYNVHQQQVVGSEPAYNFGEKIPQQSVQTLSGVPQGQYTSVQGSVPSTQE